MKSIFRIPEWPDNGPSSSGVLLDSRFQNQHAPCRFKCLRVLFISDEKQEILLYFCKLNMNCLPPAAPPLYDSQQEQWDVTSANIALLNESPDRTTVDVSNQNHTFHCQANSNEHRLQFLQLTDWDERNTYDEAVPTCLHYSIEWKVLVNNKMISKDTEQDLVLVPVDYWHMILKPKLDKLILKKYPRNKHVRCDDTSATVSVTDRTERDLTKRFDETSIDWSVLQKQLLAWGELFRAGKKLRVDLSFNFVDSHSLMIAPKRGQKGGSATQQMLVERASQIEAEEECSSQPSIWKEVYALMKCPGSPCSLGPYCWRDSFGKKHYKLRTHQLKELIKYVEQGNILRSHEDVPENIREQLYAEDQQKLERQSKFNYATPGFPPINITNVLPSSSRQSPESSSASMFESSAVSSEITALGIPGARDEAVRKYSEWQKLNVMDDALKTEFQKACEATLEDGLDLEQVYQDQDPNFYIKCGVKRGVARRFVSDITTWAKRYKTTSNTDIE
jgi:hypothetical protein